MTLRASGRQLMAAFAGPVVWAAHFGVLYAANAVVCARGFLDQTLLGIGPVAITATLATAVAVVTIVTFWRVGEASREKADVDASTRELLSFLTRWLGGLSLVAILLSYVPVFISPRCVQYT